MKNTVERLAHSRAITAERAAQLKEAEAKLRASPLWRQWELTSGDFKTAKANMRSDEADVREQALGIYEETGDKAPHPAVPIKMYTVLEYKDEDAVNYAREHLPEALKLIKRIFEKAAKVVAMDFVAILQEPRATIARDLSKYLPGEGSE